MDLKWGFGDELTDQSHNQDNPTKVCWCKGDTNLVAMIRSSVREEVEDAIKRLVLPHLQSSGLPPSSRSSANLAEVSASRSLQLHFVGTFPDTFLTLNNIQDESASLTVELRDTSGSRVEVGPESSSKIQIVALDGDFEVEDRDHWTHEEFSKHVLEPRKGKRPLLVGDCEISLSKGVAIIGNVSFTDNSKWMKSGNFRLGAWIMKGVPPGVVRGAVSKAFKVKERRLQAYQKSKIPALEDQIWRLESIAKTGPVRQRLADANVDTLKDFLQLYHSNAKRLQEIVRVPEKKWLGIVKNAELCSLTNEHYQYYDETTGIELLLDCVFNIVTVTFVGQNSMPYEILVDSQKEFVNGLREIAYEKRNELPKIFIPTNQVMVQAQPVCPSSISCTNIQYIDATTINQGDQQVLQVNSYSQDLLQTTLGNEDNYQVEAQYFDPWIDEILNTVPLQEERGNEFEGSTDDDKVTSKLKAACYVTKAAMLFMISIQQESPTPRKKQKLQ